MKQCPVCGAPIEHLSLGDYGREIYAECPNCGLFGITRSALRHLEIVVQDWPQARALLTHALRRATQYDGGNSGNTPLFDRAWVERVLSDRRLPSPSEQAANLVLWLGNRLVKGDPAEVVRKQLKELATVMGAAGVDGASYVIESLFTQGKISRTIAMDFADLGLTFSGWNQFEDQRRSHSEGPIAFMAMPFGYSDLDAVYRNQFKPAVRDCGFDLRRIDEKPPAGSIDNRLRVEIRRSRFLIVDLTHHNPGAYWEAGFAEGLDKPVIFTCEKEHFPKIHFDTNHQHTIVWAAEAIDKAVADLKNTIRATLPGEAKLTDEGSS